MHGTSETLYRFFPPPEPINSFKILTLNMVWCWARYLKNYFSAFLFIVIKNINAYDLFKRHITQKSLQQQKNPLPNPALFSRDQYC